MRGIGKRYGRKCGETCLTPVTHSIRGKGTMAGGAKIEEINLWSVLIPQNCSFGGVEIRSKARSFLYLIKKGLVKLNCNKTLRPQGGKITGLTLSISLFLSAICERKYYAPASRYRWSNVSMFKEQELFVATQLRAIQTVCPPAFVAAWKKYQCTSLSSPALSCGTDPLMPYSLSAKWTYWSKMFFSIH